MGRCSKSDCGRDARYVPTLNVPMTGVPRDSQKCVSIIVNLELCGPCITAAEADPWALVPGDGQDHLRALMARQRTVPLDFARTFIERLRIGHPRHRQFLDMVRDSALTAPRI